MKLSEIIQNINNLIDDELPPDMITRWVNDGIARVNVEMDANFPFLSLENDDSPVFPEKWQRLLLVVFASARAKQQDSSQFEYTDLYMQFLDNLSEFKVKYTVPDEYVDSDSKNNSSISPIFSTHMFRGGW